MEQDQKPSTQASGAPSWANVHPKVASAAIASLAVAVVLPILKQKLGLDLSGQEGNLQALIAVLAGYFMPNSQ